MLSQLSSNELTEMLGFYSIKSGKYEEDEKKRNAARNLKNSLAHKVKKRGS